MALSIKEKNNEFIIEGILNATTVKHFKAHCKTLLDVYGSVCVNLNKIKHIDIDGLLAIKSLYEYANTSKTNFCMAGDSIAKQQQPSLQRVA